MIIFVILAVLAVVGGALSLSNATAGVGIIAIGCFLAICARIAQAGQQHAALLAAVRTVTAEPHPTAPGPDQIKCEKCGRISHRGPTTCTCGHRYGTPATLTVGGQTVAGIQMTE